MKYLLSLLIASLLVITSCKKHHDDGIPGGVDDGCIERFFFKAKNHPISSTDVSTVDNLFSKTKIDNSKLIYYQFKHDSLQDDYAPYTKHDRKIVWTNQYDRGMTIFDVGRVFVFLDDTLSIRNSDMTDLASLMSGIDTIPGSSLPRVRKLFRHDLEKYFPIDNSSNRIDYTDTCFKAEFGIYKEILNRGNATAWLKAWRVFKKNSANDRPVGYYDDGTGKQITFYLR